MPLMPFVVLVFLVVALVLLGAAQLAPPASRPLSWLAIGFALLAMLVQLLGHR